MEGGPPCFPRDSSCPAVLWILLAVSSCRLHDSHILWCAFPCASAKTRQCFSQSTTPVVFLHPVWPPPRSLATTCGISVDFFSSPYLDVSVQAVPPVYLCVQYTVHELSHADCSIRISADLCPLATPHSFSQLVTSFFGS